MIDYPDGRILEANDASLGLYGYTREELRSLSVHDLRSEAHRAGTTSQMAQAFERGILFETIHRRNDGRIFHAEISSKGTVIDGRRLLISIVRDITARKQAETNQVLLTSILQILNRGGDLHVMIAETLKLIHSTGFDAVGLRLRKGEDWPYFECKGFSEDFLCKENSLCRRGGDGEVVRDADGGVVLECTCGLVLSDRTDPSMSCFTRGGSFWTNAASELLMLPSEADPRTNPRNRCIHAGYESVGLFPLRSGPQIIGLLQLNDRRGGRFTFEQIVFYENLAQNIGLALQRASAERALRGNEARLAAILEQLPVGVGLLDRNGQFVLSNSTLREMIPSLILPSQDPENLSRWRALDAHGGLIPPEQWPGARALRGESVSPGVEFRYGEAPIETWRLVSAVPFRPADGDIAGAITVVHDISERKRVQMELIALTATLEQQVAERTELAEARAKQLQSLAVELIEAEERERQRISHLLHEDLQQILAAAKLQLHALHGRGPRLAELTEVERMLGESITKSRRLSRELSPAILQHSGLASALEWLARQMGEQFGMDVRITSGKDHGVETPLLKTFVFRAVQELLFNVVKHAGVKSVQVGLSQSTERMTVTVSDKGKGFDPSILEPLSGGSGLGLLSLRERSRYVGGNLVIESAPGQGSRLMLTVPRNISRSAEKPGAAPAAAHNGSRAAETAVPPGNKIRVILVDDHHVMRQGLVRLLSGQPGIEVVGEAQSGLKALALVRRLRPDVVVMDISMPEIDGIDATRRIKSEFPGIRVIGLSMFEDDHTIGAMREAGAEAFVSKTASSSHLLKAVYASQHYCR